MNQDLWQDLEGIKKKKEFKGWILQEMPVSVDRKEEGVKVDPELWVREDDNVIYQDRQEWRGRK